MQCDWLRLGAIQVHPDVCPAAVASVAQEGFSAAHHANDAGTTEAHIREAVATPAFRIAGAPRVPLAPPLLLPDHACFRDGRAAHRLIVEHQLDAAPCGATATAAGVAMMLVILRMSMQDVPVRVQRGIMCALLRTRAARCVPAHPACKQPACGVLAVCSLLGTGLIALQGPNWHAAAQATGRRLACHARCCSRGGPAGAPCIETRLPRGPRDSDDWSDAEGEVPARPARARGAFDGSAAGAASALAARARGVTGAPAPGGAAASGPPGLVSQAAKDRALALMAASAPSAAPQPGSAPAALAAALKAAAAGGLAGAKGVAAPASGGRRSGGADSGVPDAVAVQLAEAAAAQTTQAAPSQAARAAPARAAAAPVVPGASPAAPTRKATAASPAVAPAAELRPFDAQAAEVRNGCTGRQACMAAVIFLLQMCPPCRLCCRVRPASYRLAHDVPALTGVVAFPGDDAPAAAARACRAACPAGPAAAAPPAASAELAAARGRRAAAWQESAGGRAAGTRAGRHRVWQLAARQERQAARLQRGG